MTTILGIMVAIMLVFLIMSTTSLLSARHKRKVAEIFNELESVSLPDVLEFHCVDEREASRSLVLRIIPIFSRISKERNIVSEEVVVLNRSGISWDRAGNVEHFAWSDIEKVEVQENVWLMSESSTSKTLVLHVGSRELYFDETMGDYKAFRNYVLNMVAKQKIAFSL